VNRSESDYCNEQANLLQLQPKKIWIEDEKGELHADDGLIRHRDWRLSVISINETIDPPRNLSNNFRITIIETYNLGELGAVSCLVLDNLAPDFHFAKQKWFALPRMGCRGSAILLDRQEAPEPSPPVPLSLSIPRPALLVLVAAPRAWRGIFGCRGLGGAFGVTSSVDFGT
jgi:hypothetical protein